jgi:transposase
LDSTSLHLHGEYNNCLNNLGQELGMNREDLINITQGYSRDHSRDQGYSYQGEKVSYGGTEQRWLLVESADIKQADLKKFTQSIQEEFLKITKQVGRLVKEEFKQTSLAELEIKELAAKLKYHKISELES